MSISPGLYLTYVLAGPYVLFGFRNTSGQLACRGRDIHFARYHMHDKDERKAFAGAVQYLLERVPLTCDLDAFLKRWRWFAEGGVGCIGILKDWLVDAVAACLGCRMLSKQSRKPSPSLGLYPCHKCLPNPRNLVWVSVPQNVIL